MADESERDDKGRFLNGAKPGPGRPKGSRAKLGEEFVADLQAAWKEKGREVIDAVIETRPQDFLKVVAGILPKQIDVKTNAVNELEDDELASLLAALRSIAGQGLASDAGEGTGAKGKRKPSKGVSTLQ